MTEDDMRRALRAIERNLTDADPAFAARMRAPNAAAPSFPVLPVLGALAYIVIPIEALLFGLVSAVVTLNLVAGTVAILMIRRRRSRRRREGGWAH
jgi:hypothetical protein